MSRPKFFSPPPYETDSADDAALPGLVFYPAADNHNSGAHAPGALAGLASFIGL